MTYFLRILCQEKKALPPEEIIDFIEEGCYFDPMPEVTIQKQDDFNWTIHILYNKEKDPVIITSSENDPLDQKKLESIKFILTLPKQTEKKLAIRKLVESTNQIFSIQIIQDQITGECWEMLDNTEAMIMRRNKGILVTSDNEFFDADLKKIYKL